MSRTQSVFTICAVCKRPLSRFMAGLLAIAPLGTIMKEIELSHGLCAECHEDTMKLALDTITPNTRTR